MEIKIPNDIKKRHQKIHSEKPVSRRIYLEINDENRLLNEISESSKKVELEELPTVSIIIPTTGDRPVILDTLKGFEHGEILPDEILIGIDGNSDEMLLLWWIILLPRVSGTAAGPEEEAPGPTSISVGLVPLFACGAPIATAASMVTPSLKKSLTTQTPCIALASWCSIPADWPVHLCNRLMMSFSMTSGGIPG